MSMGNPFIRMIVILIGVAGLYIMAFNLFDADPLSLYGDEPRAEKAYVEAQPKSGDLTSLSEEERNEVVGKYQVIIQKYPNTKAAEDMRGEIETLQLFLDLRSQSSGSENKAE